MKTCSPLHFVGAAYLITCGVLALAAMPEGGDDTLGVMLIVNGLCWMGLVKAQQWWGDKQQPVAVPEDTHVD